MVHEVPCFTSLNLSLCNYDFPRKHRLDPQDHDRNHNQQPEMKSVIRMDQPIPSLVLGLGRDQDSANLIQRTSYSVVSIVSSFSNSSSAKRQRDDSGEEVDKVLPNAICDIVGDEFARKKLRLTKQQSLVLEESFKQHTTLNPKEKKANLSKKS
ncbi:hypothetical protein M8C21_029564 [Ambrosia artemisiifolia]|uniref:Uncharacterized protein n=1 Tax=Ambrosia artemisiifolia TaxID=4212 RepID=A0AAD5D7B4_AMBAR|nr:hypothetical protein M8C21_029564 [Ambrosia artemisiifolia]